MQKILNFSIFIFFVSVSFAQTRTTVYQGRIVKIFPYRIQVDVNNMNGSRKVYYGCGGDNFSYFFKETKFDDYAVPYCPDKLADGEYIIYYKPEIDMKDYEKSMARFAKGDTLFVAINFFIKNGVKDGPVYFYDIFNPKKPVVTGNYAGDAKNGLWKLANDDGKISTEFKAGKWDGKTVIEYKRYKKSHLITKHFKAGIKQGVEERYENKKLIESISYKNGDTYGPYSELLPDYLIKGFHLGNYTDSIISVYEKNKLVHLTFNSPTSLIATDTSEKEWMVHISQFLIGNLPSNRNIYKSVYDKFYTNTYSISKAGARINNFFLVDGKIKIPFVYLNEFGDTMQQVTRLEKTDSFIKFKTITKTYDKKRKLERIKETYTIDYKYMDKAGNVYPIYEWGLMLGYSENEVSVISYYANNIYKHYTLNRAMEGYNGWIIKKDSTSIIDKKTGKQERITEDYEIKGIRKDFTNYTRIDEFLKAKTFSWTDISYKLTNKDTIEVMEKSYLDESLNSIYTKKICTKDSSLIEGDENLINLQKVVENNTYGIQYIGQSLHILEYKGKPYTGSIVMIKKQSKKAKKYSNNLTLKEKDKTLYITQLMYKPGKLKQKISSFFSRFSSEAVYEFIDNETDFPLIFYFHYKNGILDGQQRAISNKGDEIYNLNFRNGINHGSQWYCLQKNYGLWLGYGNFLTQINYDSGRIDGYVTVLQNNEGQPKLLAKYKKGQLKGSFVQFEDTYDHNDVPLPNLEANFRNDTLQGDVVVSKYGLEKERIPFKNGKATGIYSKNYIQLVDDEHSDSVHFYRSYIRYYNELKVKITDGQIADTAYAYYENGTLKYIAVVDTDFHHQYIEQNLFPSIMKNAAYFGDTTLAKELFYPEASRYYDYKNIEFGLSSYTELPEIDFDPIYDNPKASFTFYYKNGVKSQEGKMVNGIKYRTWKYWNENGILMKEIEYKPGVDSSTENITEYRGKITAYYPSGKKLMEGLITDEELSYQCNQEVIVAYEDVYYLKFNDEAGNQILNKLTGPVSDFHLNGNKRFTGQITHGLRTGLWKFYDPNGNLNAIGEYADGVKQGKWLEGDLGGINYLDNACSVNEALSLMKEREQKDIDVSETLYEMGEKISSSHLVLEKF